MSSFNVVIQNDGSLVVDYDVSKIALGANRMLKKTFTNSTGSTLIIEEGQTMAFDPTTEEALIFVQPSDPETDGYEVVPFGINFCETSIEDSASADLWIIVEGDVNKNYVVPTADIPFFEGGHFAFRLREVTNLTNNEDL